MSLSKTTVASVLFWSILLVSSYCLAKVDCAQFSESEFYRTATKEEIAKCIEQGADLFSRSPGGETPLHWVATHSSEPDIIDLILSRIEEGGQRDDYLKARTKEGKTAIHVAAEIGQDPGVLVRIASWGADVNEPLNPGDSSIFSSVNNWRKGKGKGNTPLHLAISRNNAEPFVTTLLALGADPNNKDKRGRSPLHYEAEKASDRRLLALLLVRADPNLEDIDDNTPLHLVSTRGTNIDIINYLLKRGAVPDPKNQEGDTPLHLAAAYNESSEVVERLLELTDSPCEKDGKDASPYDYIKQNAFLQNTPAYWKLHSACFEKKQ